MILACSLCIDLVHYIMLWNYEGRVCPALMPGLANKIVFECDRERLELVLDVMCSDLRDLWHSRGRFVSFCQFWVGFLDLHRIVRILEASTWKPNCKPMGR